MADSWISNSPLDWSENESDQNGGVLNDQNDDINDGNNNDNNNNNNNNDPPPNDNEPFRKHSIPSKQPADQFSDSLSMEYIGHTKLAINDLPILRNNIVTASKIWDLLFIADRSHILVHEYNPITRKPEVRPSIVIETRPSHTTIAMRAGANWTNDPHGINFLKVATLAGKEVLASAGDDGRVQMWYTVNIQKAIRRKAQSSRYRLNGSNDISHTSSSMSLNLSTVTVAPSVLGPINTEQEAPSYSFDNDAHTKPFLVLLGNKSSWGISIHDSKRLLAVSENTCTVNVYNLGPFLDGTITSGEIEKITSPTLDHNIPDVDFIEVDNAEEGIFYVACVSISGQATMWSFYYGEEGKRKKQQEEEEETEGELEEDNEQVFEEEDENEDEDEQELAPTTPLEIVRLPTNDSSTDENETISSQSSGSRRGSHYMESFENGIWWFEENLKQEGWSINALYEDNFKAVSSLYEATGNKWLAEEPLFKYIMKENKKTLINSENQDLLGYPAIRFITNDVETKFIQKLSHAPWSSGSQERYFDLPLCKNKGEKVSNYYSQHGKSISYLQNPPFKNKFFLITTKKSLYLCQAEDLFCNAARSNVFTWESPYGSDEIYFDRLNIVEVIRPLSAVVVVSQIGAISIFRLTQYRGIFCMRQEYAFPDVEKLLFEGTRLRVLIGVSVSPIKTGGDKSLQPRYRLDIVYLDGLVLTFELSRKVISGNELFIENIVL